MLRIIPNVSAKGAKSYYSASDYYTEGQELVGLWRGEASKRLGLAGEVRKSDWDALCDNRNPETSGVLTPRQKQNRRIGYDFNFHVPKSVSVLYALTRDDRILDAFRESVNDTMQDMEAEMKTRVRKSGVDDDRITGNMAWGEFVHFTSRPVDGVPDPHLHAHCFVFNTTWDDKESRWKAGQFADLKRDAPYFEAAFHCRMARRMAELGLDVERTKKGWEIGGIPKAAIDTFSRRTNQIEKLAREKGITDPHEKAELGAKTRSRKQKNLSFDALRELWKSQLLAEDAQAIADVGEKIGGPRIEEIPAAARQAVEHAAEHYFERSAVVPERRVLAEALKRGFGNASVDSIQDQFKRTGFVTAQRQGQSFVTTREVLAEEQRMIDFARKGRGTCARLGGGSEHQFRQEELDQGQRRAVRHVLASNDRVILIRGAAGVGKTWSMRESVDAIEANGKHVFTFAPSADASRGVLREEAKFANADTVARLLVDEKLQAEIRGQVIWIDEAGLLGTKAMGQVFDLAGKLDARVILSGDRRQHGSVERGTALRLLEIEAGLIPAEIKHIKRQSGDYKRAVQALSEGRTEDAFRQLDDLKWIREVADDERYKVLAADYVDAVTKNQTALVVSPTHAEGRNITQEIRSELKRLGRLSDDERTFKALTNANLTQAQRADAINYTAGNVLLFHQNAKGYRRGERMTVGEDAVSLPLDQAARFQMFQTGSLSLAPGDVIRITHNGMTADGQHRLNNGAIYRVKGCTSDGDIVLGNDWTVSKDFGHLAYGYVVTSHASQGKSVDRVFIGQSSESMPASSREQFYVSVSRGKKQATIYTDDKQALLDAVRRPDERLTATEFMADRETRKRSPVIQRRKGPDRGEISGRTPDREPDMVMQ